VLPASLISAALIGFAAPDLWEPISQPAVNASLKPVHDIAINRSDPTVILYRAQTATSIRPKEIEEEKPATLSKLDLLDLDLSLHAAVNPQNKQIFLVF